MSRFDNVSLGGDETMRRLVAKARKERNDIIESCAVLADKDAPELAAKIRALKDAD